MDNGFICFLILIKLITGNGTADNPYVIDTSS